MSFPLSSLVFSESRRLTSAILAVALVAIGVAIYLSPSDKSSHSTAGGQAPQPTPPAVQATAPDTSTASTSPTASPAPSTSRGTGTSPTAARPGAPAVSVGPVQGFAAGAGTGSDGGSGAGGNGAASPQSVYTAVHLTTTAHAVTTQTRTATATRTRTAAAPAPRTVTRSTTAPLPHCSQFTWQQDAQAAYVANLSDPGGLDGDVGPYNGNGIACDQLKVDPNRAESKPVAGYQAPAATADTKAQLLDPDTTYFGVAEDGLPGDTRILDKIATEVDKAPNLIEYFQTLDTPFSGVHVQQAWSRGALPVVTMQLQSSQSGVKASLESIAAGDWDKYFTKYAADIRASGLPVVLRWAQEMNGDWYPWSAGKHPCDDTCDAGVQNLYVQVWRHVWNIFQDAGANDDVIWAWTPVRVDNLNPHHNGNQQTTLAEDYPGDQYVDWVGFSGYAWSPPTSQWTAASTYDATLKQLQDVAPGKPVFIAETGAANAYGGSTDGAQTGTDATDAQAAWIGDALKYIAGQSRIVGFTYFNNDSNQHVIDGQSVNTNWKLDDSAQAMAAFKAGVANPQFGSGIMPDSTGGN